MMRLAAGLSIGLWAVSCADSGVDAQKREQREVMAPPKLAQVPLGQALGESGDIAPGTDPAVVAADLDLLVGLHVRLVRRDFQWSTLEPSPGEFTWAGEDALVEATAQRGLAPLGILDYNVAWDAAGGDLDSPPDPAQFAAFAAAVAGRYRGQVAAWEIWNEENAGYRFWHPIADPAAYGELLVQAAAAIRAADPDVPVVLGGLYYHDYGILSTGDEAFLGAAYKAHPDLGRSFDALGLHPYPLYPPQAAPEDSGGLEVPLEQMIAQMRALLAANGDGGKPIWVTEYGWPVWGLVDQAAQARYLVRGAVEALSAGAERACFFTLLDGAHPKAFPPEDAFGIVQNDGTPKIAAAALRTLLGIDPTAVLEADLSAGAVRHYRFAGQASRFHVLYATDGLPHLVLVDSPHGTVLDMQGQPLKASPAALLVGADPIYVVDQ